MLSVPIHIRVFYAQTEKNLQLLECTAVTNFQSHSRCPAARAEARTWTLHFYNRLVYQLENCLKTGLHSLTAWRRHGGLLFTFLDMWSHHPLYLMVGLEKKNSILVETFYLALSSYSRHAKLSSHEVSVSFYVTWNFLTKVIKRKEKHICCMDPSLRPALKRLLSNLTLATVTMEANERKQRAYGACISGSQIRESLEGAVGFFTFSKSKTQE